MKIFIDVFDETAKAATAKELQNEGIKYKFKPGTFELIGIDQVTTTAFTEVIVSGPKYDALNILLGDNTSICIVK